MEIAGCHFPIVNNERYSRILSLTSTLEESECHTYTHISARFTRSALQANVTRGFDRLWFVSLVSVSNRSFLVSREDATISFNASKLLFRAPITCDVIIYRAETTCCVEKYLLTNDIFDIKPDTDEE